MMGHAGRTYHVLACKAQANKAGYRKSNNSLVSARSSIVIRHWSYRHQCIIG